MFKKLLGMTSEKRQPVLYPGLGAFRHHLGIRSDRQQRECEPGVRRVLEELFLMEYANNFARELVVYEDFPLLDPDMIEQLIPFEVPRRRLTDWIDKTFPEARSSDDDPLVLEPTRVTFDAESAGLELEGVDHAVRTGRLAVGISDLPVRIELVVLDGVKHTKERVRDDFRLLSRLRHANVMAHYGFWFDDQTAFLVTEYIPDGIDLLAFRRERPEMSSLSKVKILLKVALALKHMHDHEVAHESLSHENVIFSLSSVKVGFAQVGDVKAGRVEEGNPSYLAPEQFRGENADRKLVDCFAFGILCWVFWCGKAPYEFLSTKTPFEILTAVHGASGSDQILRPNLEDPSFGDCPLLSLIERCWETNPDRRPSSFDDVVEDLQHVFPELGDETD